MTRSELKIFGGELKEEILNIKLAEARLETDDPYVWDDIKYFITDNIDMITRKILLKNDGEIHAFETVSCMDYDALIYSYIALINMGVKNPIIHRYELRSSDNGFGGSIILNNDVGTCFKVMDVPPIGDNIEYHGRYSLFDYRKCEQWKYDRITEILIKLMIKVLPADKLEFVFREMCDEAKEIVVHLDLLKEDCGNLENRMILIRFLNEHGVSNQNQMRL